jgi:ABC-2 type transport system ATP-binding protein
LAEVEQLATHVGIVGRGRLLFEGSLADLQSRERELVVVEVDRPAASSSILHQAGWAVERVDDVSVTVNLRERGDVARAAAMLVGAGLSLFQLRTVRPSLEDLFLELTSGAKLGTSAVDMEGGRA